MCFSVFKHTLENEYGPLQKDDLQGKEKGQCLFGVQSQHRNFCFHSYNKFFHKFLLIN